MKVLKPLLLFIAFFVYMITATKVETLTNNNLGSAVYTPVVLWHGMGDSGYDQGSLGRIITTLENELNGVVVKSLQFGSSMLEDIEKGYIGDANSLVNEACEKIANVTELKNGYNAIGFSQGSQFLRAVAQRCPNPPMKNLISIGGQHQGVYGLPHCGDSEPFFCDSIRRMLNCCAYSGFIQNNIIQAQYWHDPLNEEMYKENSIFLAEINNEKTSVARPEYADNLNNLQNLVLVKFKEDSMVVPKESSWFGFYASGQAEVILHYNETKLYQNDTIGLKKMDESSKLHFLEVDGDHLQFTDEWFIDTIINKFLKD